jgi:hypothetical protein
MLAGIAFQTPLAGSADIRDFQGVSGFSYTRDQQTGGANTPHVNATSIAALLILASSAIDRVADGAAAAER